MDSSFHGSVIPFRFICLLGHVIAVCIAFYSRNDNIRADLPISFSHSDYDSRNNSILAALGISLVLFLIELLGLLGGFSWWVSAQHMFSITCHSIGCLMVSFFIFDKWRYIYFWWMFGFLTSPPAIVELALILRRLFRSKPQFD